MDDTFDQRCERLVAEVYGGLHNGPQKIERTWYWSWTDDREWSTFDFSRLSLLVFWAHFLCLRAQISGCGPRRVKIMLHDRKRQGAMHERHPSLEDAVAEFLSNRRKDEFEVAHHGRLLPSPKTTGAQT